MWVHSYMRTSERETVTYGCEGLPELSYRVALGQARAVVLNNVQTIPLSARAHRSSFYTSSSFPMQQQGVGVVQMKLRLQTRFESRLFLQDIVEQATSLGARMREEVEASQVCDINVNTTYHHRRPCEGREGSA
jgi:hypothetical protein